MLIFHPAAQIFTWCLLVTSVQHLSLVPLLTVTTLVVLTALRISTQKLLQLIRRTRWLMFSLLLVYAYSTSGQPIFDALQGLSPSFEGVQDGMMQLARLWVALAGLAILLDKLHRQHWMVGIYTLLLPLHYLGLSRDRFTIRLALTLHYAEVAMLRGTQSWKDVLQGLSGHQEEQIQTLTLPVYRYALTDGFLLAFSSLILWLSIR